MNLNGIVSENDFKLPFLSLIVLPKYALITLDTEQGYKLSVRHTINLDDSI